MGVVFGRLPMAALRHVATTRIARGQHSIKVSQGRTSKTGVEHGSTGHCKGSNRSHVGVEQGTVQGVELGSYRGQNVQGSINPVTPLEVILRHNQIKYFAQFPMQNNFSL